MKVSVVTINYNNEVGLAKTIKSVLNQQYSDFEYIIIDGGSTDGSTGIIEHYKNSIDHWVSEGDNGIYDAMNKGIKKANGEFLFFLNSGDLFYSNDVLMKIAPFLSDETELVYGDVEQSKQDGTKQIVSYPSVLKFSFLFAHVISHQAMFINKKLFQRVGLYDLQYKYAADWIHFVKCVSLHHASYKYVPIAISCFDNNGITSQPDTWKIIRQERRRFFKQYFSEYFEDYEALAHYHRRSDLVKWVEEVEKISFFRKVAKLLILPLYWLSRKANT